MNRSYYVYILTTRKNTSLYTGVSNDLIRRVWEHKQANVPGFTKNYGVNKLVYYEEYNDVKEAIHREKCIKRWKRAWKIELIEKMNPQWEDLYYEEDSNQIPAFAGMTKKVKDVV